MTLDAVQKPKRSVNAWRLVGRWEELRCASSVAPLTRPEGKKVTDQSKGSPIHVSTDRGAGPYIRLPFSQLDDLKRILDGHGISYSVRENVISLGGGPFMAVVYLGRGANA